MTTPDNITKFTEAYFLEECSRLRQMMGEKTFWQKDEDHRDAALKGLFYVYCNIYNDDGTQGTPEQLQRWANILEMTTNEYARRKTKLMFTGVIPF